MQVSITYCTMWNYYPKAASLAEAIKGRLGIDPTLIKGSNGIFDVTIDGNLIYSKHQTGRFPENAEILAKLQPD